MRTAKQLNDEVALLVGQFFQPMVYEDMKDEFTETFEAAKQGPEALLQCFQDPVRSDLYAAGVPHACAVGGPPY